MGFKQSTSDPCIYTSKTKSDGLLILAVYIDDILLAGKSQQKIAQVKADFGRRFQLKDMDELHYFLGVSVQQCSDEIWIGQPTYTQAIIKKFGMEHCKPANTPVTQGTKLLKATEQADIASHVGRFCSGPTKEHWTAVKCIIRYLTTFSHI